MQAKKRRINIPALLFFIAIIGFFFFYIRSIDFSQVFSVSFDWKYVVGASIVGISFRFWGVVIWRAILKELGAHRLPAFAEMSYVYAKAWMGRYIPGTVTWIAGKVYMANNLGISKSRLTVSALLEGGMQIVAIMSVSMLIIGFDPRLDVIATALKIALVVIGCLALLALSPPVFNRLIALAFKLVKRQQPSHELKTNNSAVLRSFFLYAFGTFISGTAGFLLIKSMSPTVGMNQYLYIVGSFNLAGAIGMATPFVPSGLGARDSVQLILLSVIFPRELALTMTITIRLWSAATDVLFYFVCTLWHKARFRHQEPVVS